MSWLVGGSLLVLLHWLLHILRLLISLWLVDLLLVLLGLICLLLTVATVGFLAVAAIALLVVAWGSILLMVITIYTSGCVLITVVWVDRLGLWLHSAIVIVPNNGKPVLFKGWDEVSELTVILMAFNDRINRVDGLLVESVDVNLVCIICIREFTLCYSLRISKSLGAICN